MKDAVQQLIDNRPNFSAMEPANLTKAIKITDNIWMSTGTSNAYMVLTNGGRVIINTGMGFEALTHKKIFDDVCVEEKHQTTPYIILTQGHVDHVGGVALFRDEGTQLIAQVDNAICQRDDERIQKARSAQAYIWFQKTIDSAMEVAKTNPGVFIQNKPVPDITFLDFYSFTCGDTLFEIYSTPGGETIDSCIVWLPQEKILFSGNVFGPLFPHFPNINTIRGDKYRYMEPYLQSLHLVRSLNAEMLITGHFEPIIGKELITECLNRLDGAVDFVHTETLKGMNSGKDIFSLMREVQLPEHLTVGQGYGKVSWGVRTIWESYMGWFKAQSTSELYPTQPKEIYADIVDLCGIDKVIERGRKKFAENNLESALLLAEIALQADKKNISALQLSLAVHKQLYANCNNKNFWESGWLKSQIFTLETAIKKL